MERKVKINLLLIWEFLLLFFLVGNSLLAQNDIVNIKKINRIALGEWYNSYFDAIDSSGKIIEYKFRQLPDWLTFDVQNNLLRGKAGNTGQFFVEFEAKTSASIVVRSFYITVFDHKTRNILALGNSITNGTANYNSYRRPLWKILHKSGYNFDFIGSWDKQHMGAEFPDPDFDMDHEGHSGWTAYNVLFPPEWDLKRGNIDNWLENYVPDIVLFEFGTNEVFQCLNVEEAINNFSLIFEKLRRKNANVVLLVALLPPLGKQWATKSLCGNDETYQMRLERFNLAICNFVAISSNQFSQVILVDQFSGINPSRHMYDDIHPNKKGEKIMAKKWFSSLIPYLSKL